MIEHITDIRELAEEMAMTAEGVPGMNLTLSKARIARICRAFLEATRPSQEPVPFFAQPEAFMHFLEQAGDGRISGSFDEWPQFRPACRWAAEQINNAKFERLAKEPPSEIAGSRDGDTEDPRG